MSSYEKLYSDDCKNYTDDESLEENIEFQQQGRRWNSKWLFYSLLMLLTNTASFLTGKYWPSTPLQHLQALTTWSPLHGSWPYKLHQDSLNATTWSSNPSLWRADPSVEGDKLWSQNWDTHPILIPMKDMPKLGQDPSYVAPWLDDPSLAMVGSQAHHLLHCLDVLRKAVWTDHYWPNGNLNPGHRNHQTHCVDLLRQDLMCRAPMDVYPLIWMDGESQPTPNFNVTSQCADWEGMTQWWREKQMTDEQVDRIWVKPEGVKQWPAPGGLEEEKEALRDVCARPNVTCTLGGEPLIFPDDDENR